MSARYNSYRFADDLVEDKPEVQLNDLTPDAIERLKEELIDEVSLDDLITELEERGMGPYVGDLIKASIKRVNGPLC